MHLLRSAVILELARESRGTNGIAFTPLDSCHWHFPRYARATPVDVYMSRAVDFVPLDSHLRRELNDGAEQRTILLCTCPRRLTSFHWIPAFFDPDSQESFIDYHGEGNPQATYIPLDGECLRITSRLIQLEAARDRVINFSETRSFNVKNFECLYIKR